MAKAKAKSVGAPPTKIDWEFVGNQLIKGVTLARISRSTGVSVDTYRRQCLAQNNINFAAFRQQKKATGELMLTSCLYDCAMMAREDPRYITMAIFLAKAMLGMTDKPKEDTGNSTVSLTVNKGNEGNA
jgi:hypothetical protein